jgi:glycerol-3-phosphate dehydrogenase
MAAVADAPSEHKSDMTRREVMFLVEKEKIVHLNGLLLRRTKLANPGRSTLPLVGELAKYVSQTLGWSKNQMHSEVERTLGILTDRIRCPGFKGLICNRKS